MGTPKKKEVKLDLRRVKIYFFGGQSGLKRQYMGLVGSSCKDLLHPESQSRGTGYLNGILKVSFDREISSQTQIVHKLDSMVASYRKC